MHEITMPGFPAAVSEVIDVPDMAELLMYPMFTNAHADTVWKNGCEFQKYLLSKVPLKYNRKNVTVYSSVHVVSPHMRPITTFNAKHNTRGMEWHIDGYEKFMHDHFEPHETIYLLLSNASKPTEFNTKELHITDPAVLAMNRIQYSEYMNKNADKFISGAPIKNNVLYEFSNHLHRAVMPDRPEFRYTFRVRETDREDFGTYENGQMPKSNHYWDIYSNSWKESIALGLNNSVVIQYPKEWLDY